MKKVLITTAIDYSNDVIHIGHAYEKILADSIVRYFRLKNGKENVGFVTGTDEHGSTNEKAAKEKGIPTLQHVTEVAEKNRAEFEALNISFDRFIRTTDEDHKKIASDFFKRSFDNGNIYKGEYEGLYCEGCESYKTLSELNEDGQCLLHPTRQIQKYKEENYFFKWSRYSDFLKELVGSSNFVVPESRRAEMLSLIEQGLQDIPVTRPKFKLPWGITCPIDEDQVIYVWFDALINYYTFGSQNNLWNEDTEIIHFVGKDIARWHTLLWPAMLKSVGYKIPDKVVVHGFLNLAGEKISKSRGNVISPSELVEKYGVDAVRYYFLRYGPISEDVDVSIAHLEEIYNGELANGLGNTVSRIAKLAQNSGLSFPADTKTDLSTLTHLETDFRADYALQNIWKKLAEIDKHVNENEPWKIKDEAKLKEILEPEVAGIREVATLLQPFLPKTSETILSQFGGEKITAVEGLFPRLN